MKKKLVEVERTVDEKIDYLDKKVRSLDRWLTVFMILLFVFAVLFVFFARTLYFVPDEEPSESSSLPVSSRSVAFPQGTDLSEFCYVYEPSDPNESTQYYFPVFYGWSAYYESPDAPFSWQWASYQLMLRIEIAENQNIYTFGGTVGLLLTQGMVNYNREVTTWPAFLTATPSIDSSFVLRSGSVSKNAYVSFKSSVSGQNYSISSGTYQHSISVNGAGPNVGFVYNGGAPLNGTPAFTARFNFNGADCIYGFFDVQDGPTVLYDTATSSNPVLTRQALTPIYIAVGYSENGITQGQYIQYGQQQFQLGYNQGKVDGYNEGVSDGNTDSLRGMIFALFDAPVQTINGLLNFEVLGINMKTFFLSLVSITLVCFLISKFRGK